MSPRNWRRATATAVAGAALVGGLAAGLPAPAALADPVPAPSTDGQKPPMTADQALAIIAQDYDLGSGGGQLSNLIHQVLVLRGKGFKPSAANREAITAALDKRPNQAPLIAALEQTLTYQRKLQMRAANQVQQPAVAPPATPGIVQAPMGPGWGPGNPMIKDPDDNIFPMPGRTG
ncbi:hypothetical protein ASG82_19420 [Mycobacterium sp. Soil538]|nr:hypothetical protein ASG82_19420 [Mycobacterium sp. Soil538]